MKNPKEHYAKRRDKYHRKLLKQLYQVNLISNLRFITFGIGVLLPVFFYLIDKQIMGVAALAVAVIIFFILVVKHQQAIDDKKYWEQMVKVNDDSLKRLDGGWKNFADTGAEFHDQEHPYAQDLDLFGPSSLFQLINTATTYWGREKLKQILTEPCKDIEHIIKRQEAVQELSKKLDFRQQLIAQGNLSMDKCRNPQLLLQWFTQSNKLFLHPLMILTCRILPVITIIVMAAALILPQFPYYWAVMAVGVQVGLLVPKNKQRANIFDMAYQYRQNLRAYSKIIALIEKEHFSSSKLKHIQQHLVDNKQQTASQQLQQLERIVDAIAMRYNQLYVFLNIFLLWDYQCLIALEKWKSSSGDSLEKWLKNIARIEALASLAVLQYDNPQWAMPEICDKPHVVAAEKMGHPLLTHGRVCNDLVIENPVRILLITGSNMSGKSTLLRTSGINLVLAYIGAPVCATKFKCSLMELFTCMRVSDNLDQNISSFYAELLRIKMIVKASEAGKSIFFLLDEIFKGTNSWDRHTGARVLIEKLGKEGAMGLVSTHDLELGDLEKKNKKVNNYHFTETYENNQIKFDYQLKPGLSNTRNAVYLMKMAGIHIEESPKSN